MHTLLIVEDEVITSDLLRRYFEIVGYEVINAHTGAEAIRLATESVPQVIILDIGLPDMDGYEVCKRLRSNERTDSIPIIFLTQKDNRTDRLEGLELGADDYITKPFDVEELRLRVHNIAARLGGVSLVDARTSLPNTGLIKERLPGLLENPGTVFFDVEILEHNTFARHYGPVAANQVIRSTAKLIGDLLHEVDPQQSFIGHPSNNHFLLAVKADAAERVEGDLPLRFEKRLSTFYERSDLRPPNPDKPDAEEEKKERITLMSLTVTRATADDLRQFAAATEQSSGGPEPKDAPPRKGAQSEKREAQTR